MITRQLLCGMGNGAYVASLAFIGGVTNKPRIGGEIVTQDGHHGSLLFLHCLIISFVFVMIMVCIFKKVLLCAFAQMDSYTFNYDQQGK